MSQQAYILQSREGTYVAVSNGGQAIRVTPCETIDDVVNYLIKSQRTPIRDYPPYLDAKRAEDFKPVTDYDFAVLNSLVSAEEANDVMEKSESPSFLSGISSRIPVLMAILRIK